MQDRNLALEVVRITEAAAMASARLMGKGDRKLADHVAVEAMRRAFDAIDIRGTVVIGEGEREWPQGRDAPEMARHKQLRRDAHSAIAHALPSQWF